MVEKDDSDDEEKINYISFNQDYSCFCIGTGKGFKVFTSYPFKKLFEREFGPIGIIEMLYRSNLLIIVKAAKKPPFLEEKMIIYDDHGNKSVGELTFKAPIRAIKVTKQYLIASIEGKVYINGFTDLKSITSFPISTPFPNVLAMCYNNPIVAFPTEKKGYCQVYNIEASKIIADIKVAESHVACLGLNDDGTLLATASEKGTLIRVFDLKDGGKQKKEVRRGSDRAEIFHLIFDKTSDFLACSSDKGTIHLFIVGDSGEGAKSTLKSLGSYFKGERSFAKFRLTGITPKCIITEDRKLVVITKEGCYYVVEVDWTKGGECLKLDKKPLLEEEEEAKTK